LSIGQLSLFNLLKAYSLLDRQVGYCQGLSFVAGILLLHVDSEDEAFELMRHLMFNFGLRKQYLPSMDALHLQLYQMTRLLRDYELEIFDHFDKHDISPSLYAAPWFLTLFASQFPLGFVARLLDLIYLIGIEAIFRVSLTLLAYHRSSILECSSLELTMDFMRDGLSKIDDKNLVKIFNDALSLDLRNKLIEYEIEYSFYCAEDKARNQLAGSTHHNHHHYRGLSAKRSENSSSSTDNQNAGAATSTAKNDNDFELDLKTATKANDSAVADATATVIIQHLLANHHLKTLRSNYSY
jgi:TBC1 domain-containing protein 4